MVLCVSVGDLVDCVFIVCGCWCRLLSVILFVDCYVVWVVFDVNSVGI